MKLTTALPLLVVALSQAANAALFTTANTGNWGDSAGTWGGAGVPQTFGGNDSVQVNPTHLLSYDGTINPGVGGNLLVAFGNEITLAGGSMNQTWAGPGGPFGLGMGIGVSHPVSGVGKLHINGAGLFDTGTADSIAVGFKNAGLGGSPGKGTVNINEGSFFLNAAAGAGSGLGVGIDAGAVGTINVGDSLVGGAQLNLQTNNALLTIGGSLLDPTGGTGTVNVLSDGTLLSGTKSINVGDGAGSNGTLVNGGTLTTGAINIGRGAGSTGLATINAGTNTTGGLWAGRSGGNGTLQIFGGTTSAADLSVGRDGGSNGLLEITSGTIHPAGETSIARDGGSGDLEISGGNLNSDLNLTIGRDGGTGIVNQTGGNVTYGQWAAIGVGGGPDCQWDISGGTIGGAGFEVGADRKGIMNVSGTAQVIVPNATVGVRNTGIGQLNVIGGRFQTLGNFSVGGGQSAGKGTVDYTGGVLESGEFRLGITGGTGTINVRNGDYLQHGWGEIGSGGGATGNLNVIGATARYVHTEGGGDLQAGYNGGTGNIDVSGGGKLITNWWLNMSRGGGSNSTVEVHGAGSEIQMDTTSSIGNGGPRLNVGEDGIGTMNLYDSGKLIIGTPGGAGGREVYIGRNAGSHGLLTVKSGAEIQANGNWAFIIGQQGAAGNPATGEVDVETGGKVLSNNWLVIGNEGNSVGTLIVSDGLVQSGNPGGPHEGRLIVGRWGRALVNQSGGTVRADNWFAIGLDGNGPDGGDGTYNFLGGKIELAMPNFGDRNILVGNNGTGNLNITHGTPAGDTIQSSIVDGTFGRSFNYFNVGGDSNGNGKLTVNLADPAGVIVHRELYAAWSSGGQTTTSTGEINILNGTLRTTEWVEIGRGQANAGGVGTVNIDGPAAVWDRGVGAPGVYGVVKDINVGQGENNNKAKGYINVRNGGRLNQNWWINLARQHGAEGHMVIENPGSMVNMIDAHLVGRGGDGNSQLNVGEGGTGTLDILDGGVFNHNMDLGGGEVYVARNDSSAGTMTVNGFGSEFNSQGREFRIGSNNLGVGNLNITDGGLVDFSSHYENGTVANGNFGLAENNDSFGAINMNNGGQLNITAWSLFGAWNQAAAEAKITMTNSTINIQAHPALGDGGHLFWGDAGTATINQEGGAINAQGWSAIGRERGGDAYYNLGTGGGGGMMTVGGSGGNELYVGRQSHGTINMGTGSSIIVANLLNLAQETSPTSPSSGAVNNTGGFLSVGGEFNVGRNGPAANSGVYTQNFDALMTSQLLVNGQTYVGRDSTQGAFNMNGGTVQLNQSLEFGPGGGTGNGNFLDGLSNVNGNLIVSSLSSVSVGWDLNINNGAASNAGDLSILGGLARIDGTATAGDQVIVGSGGTLAGTGTVAATNGVVVKSGGAVAPGASPGTLTIDQDVTFNGGSRYEVEIASLFSYDVLVAGNMVINGTVKVTLTGGYNPAAGTQYDVVNALISGMPTFDFSAAPLDPGLVWNTNRFMTEGILCVVSVGDPVFDAWALSNGVTGGKNGDDDNDGASNLLEFATGSKPKDGGSIGNSYGKVVTVGGVDILTLTVAARAGAVFVPAGAVQTATQDRVIYLVQGSNELGVWNSVVVSELNPADSAAAQAQLTLPPLAAQWTWHTFRTDDSLSTDDRDFIRMTVAPH